MEDFILEKVSALMTTKQFRLDSRNSLIISKNQENQMDNSSLRNSEMISYQNFSS